MKVKNDHRSKFSNLSNWKEEAWKKKNPVRRWPVVSPTRPFANVTPHMYITRSAMASHDTKKPGNNVYTQGRS